MTSNITKITGGQKTLDMTEEMAGRIRDVIGDYAEKKPPIALIVGVLFIVAVEMMGEGE